MGKDSDKILNQLDNYSTDSDNDTNTNANIDIDIDIDVDIDKKKQTFGYPNIEDSDLQGKIYVDANKAKRINLNTVTEEELKMHPYFKFKVARVIVNYRNQHGNYKNFNELLNIKIINDSILNRIKIYGVIE